MKLAMAVMLLWLGWMPIAAKAGSPTTCLGRTITPGSATSLLCSNTFAGFGKCNGQDQIAILATPWEPASITIVGVSYVQFGNAVGLQYMFSGNGYTPDVMLMSGPGQSAASVMFPQGTGFQLPPRGQGGHVDLHISCTGGSFQTNLTIYYTVP